MLRKLQELNQDRTLLANAGMCFCVIAMLGLGNLVCRFVLHTDMSYLMPWLLVGVVSYFFLPCLILWIATGKPS
ncbi:hypothetical protein KMAL_22150 [Novacetimonas maltaceti]|uniref:Uncharacterized protein n=1 Tax=Novacetimonas maltaceti TaxID=1203393 RepID=A0A2S3W004_9PROT|nr:hypothetical protein KMAL_22150 [Novacetimonas maltaceti]